MAKMARPRIRPLKVPNGPSTEVYVYFAHPYTVRSLKADSAWSNAQQNGMPRGLDNPLFTGAIGMWDGIVVVETDKIAVLDDVGNGTSDVAQNFLCGAQAMLWALGGVEGDRLGFLEEAFDYKNKKGVAIESMYEVVKARFATGAAGVTKDHGVLTSYVSCVADYIAEKQYKPKAVIYLTDGYIESDFRVPQMPLLWGLVDNDTFTPHTGKVLRIKP
jgi:hypothetical protein